MVTLDDAMHCPICEFAGEEVETKPGNNNSTVHVIACRNVRCRWNNTTWIVQELSDGSIPVRGAGPKQFPAVPGMTTAVARKRAKDIQDEPDAEA